MSKPLRALITRPLDDATAARLTSLLRAKGALDPTKSLDEQRVTQNLYPIITNILGAQPPAAPTKERRTHGR